MLIQLHYLPYRKTLPKLHNLHVLVRKMHHGRVLHPSQPCRYVRGEIPAEQLRRQRVQRANGDADLHIHAAGSYEEADALGHHRVQQKEAQQREEHSKRVGTLKNIKSQLYLRLLNKTMHVTDLLLTQKIKSN